MEALNNPSFPWKEWECLLELEKKHQIVNFEMGMPMEQLLLTRTVKKIVYDFFLCCKDDFFMNLQMVYEVQGESHRWVADKKLPSTLDIPNGHVCVVHRDQPNKVVLNLWPIGLASVDPKSPELGRQFFYFNASKTNPSSNSTMHLHFRDRSLWTQFHEVIPIAEWKKVSNRELDIFRERVEALTEVFSYLASSKRKCSEDFVCVETVIRWCGAPWNRKVRPLSTSV